MTNIKVTNMKNTAGKSATVTYTMRALMVLVIDVYEKDGKSMLCFWTGWHKWRFPRTTQVCYQHNQPPSLSLSACQKMSTWHHLPHHFHHPFTSFLFLLYLYNFSWVFTDGGKQIHQQLNSRAVLAINNAVFSRCTCIGYKLPTFGEYMLVGGFLCALRAQGWGICLVSNVHFLICILVLDINCQHLGNVC